MPELIEDFLSTPIPEKLWHYTTVDALEGILSTQTVFATEVHHTTDPDEFTHARSVASDYLARIAIPDEAARRFKDAGRGLLNMAFSQDGPLSPDHHQIFVASFSGSSDKRSQWELYSKEATGVSIAFDLRGIRPPKELDSGISFSRCLYQDKDKELLLHEAISVWADARERLYQNSTNLAELKHWYDNQRAWDHHFGTISSKAELLERKQHEFQKLIRPAVLRSSFELLRIASHCKKGRFLDEDEWRLALPHRVGKELKHSEIRYRGEHANIPYVAHNLFHFRLPISEVVLGPQCRFEHRVRLLLSIMGSPVPVTRSKLSWVS